MGTQFTGAHFYFYKGINADCFSFGVHVIL